jgi:hypothetical protein
MKITIIRNDVPIRIYNHPRDVIVHPITNRVEIFNADGSVLEEFKMTKKEVKWLENLDIDCTEVIVNLHVE